MNMNKKVPCCISDLLPECYVYICLHVLFITRVTSIFYIKLIIQPTRMFLSVQKWWHIEQKKDYHKANHEETYNKIFKYKLFDQNKYCKLNHCFHKFTFAKLIKAISLINTLKTIYLIKFSSDSEFRVKEIYTNFVIV